MLSKIRKIITKIRWRKLNCHNNTSMAIPEGLNHILVGNNSYGRLSPIIYNKNFKLIIGNYCSIANEVTFIIGGSHDYNRISLWPFQTIVYKQPSTSNDESFIIVEDDVWIGYGATILTDVRIGRGSVIAAKSVVAKDVPPYSIYIGNKVYKKRFSDDIIEKLMRIDFSKINHIKGDAYEKYCQEKINEENIDEMIDCFTKK